MKTENSVGQQVEVSIVFPCLNEERTIGRCVETAQKVLIQHGIKGEIVVSDNGSTDNSRGIAKSLGVKVVSEPRKGYGHAYLMGLAASSGKYIITSDSDESYDMRDMYKLVLELREGADFVIGNRFKGGIEKGAMPLLHKYFGNPIMSWLVKLFFKTDVSDVQSGMRGFTREAYKKMDLRSTGFELATEFVVKTALLNLKMKEVPIRLCKDGRDRKPHLRSWIDGWRNLRFMLMYSPDYTFLAPGSFFMITGMLLMLLLLKGPLRIGMIQIDYHLMILGSVLSILGFQILNLGIFAKSYVFTENLHTGDKWIEKFLRRFKLENWLIVGISCVISGSAVVGFIIFKWLNQDFTIFAVRPAILALTLIVIGTQIIFSSLIVSMFLIPKR